MPINSIFGVFAKSPIQPIQLHMDKVAACCELLIPFFKACHEQNWSEAETVRKTISKFEKEADDLKRELRLTLPKGLFMPISRGDFIELINRQDKIANAAKDISGRILGRKLRLPDEIANNFMTYLQRCLDAIQQAKKAIDELDELLETGFRGREVDVVTKMIAELALIEEDTDTLQRKLRRDLLAVEQHHNPVDIMFLYQIIEWVGHLADHSELIGTQLELILVR
ncbi:TIGR00153 family protein [Psychromonas antarctica]|jgi:predicted phosphate transport protein (TIGR00153 family)|uniref:TIGR00153 family protein n=1 Tax=Psychromonas antarctica TaxID=67573 RepID=UPI001EE87C2F|nr:TIGR00153 family protein [Psychromonas antarctica]MCG6200679.1 TIGR00153 family protein [Psychromonas antarctica]